MTVTSRVGELEIHHGTVTWGELAIIFLTLAPDICASCRHWFTNDGDGLDADHARALADVVEARLHDGTIDRIIAAKRAEADAATDENCSYCGGSGVRSDAVGQKLGFVLKPIVEDGHPRQGQIGWCNGCGGRGLVRPMHAYYVLDRSVVEEVLPFLKNCGGFNIW